MPALDRIQAFSDAITAWRHDLHAHPELLYDVERTAGFVELCRILGDGGGQAAR